MINRPLLAPSHKTLKNNTLLIFLLVVLSLQVIAQNNIPSQNPKGIDYTLTFIPGEAGSIHTPLYSPYGMKIPLKEVQVKNLQGYNHLTGSFVIGDSLSLSSTHSFIVAREKRMSPYNLLILDTDLDGDFSDEQMIEIQPNQVRGKYWSSFNDIQVQAGYQINGKQITEPYPISMWVVVEDSLDTPDVIRFSRKGFRLASVNIEEFEAAVILSDGNNDGIFNENDWWYIRSMHANEKLRESRKVGDFAWLNGQAWKLSLSDRAGKKAKLLPFDPGMTEEEDLESRDMYLADKEAPKAKTPLKFSTDHTQIINQAKDEGKNYFIKFEAVWCGPCKLMDKYVYTAEAVVKSVKNIICLKIDGDEQPDLAKKYTVNAYPTGILFDADGNELKRFEGYKSVREMKKFFTPK